MLTPNKKDPKRKEQLARKKEVPADWGYTGPRRRTVRVTEEEYARIKAPPAKAAGEDKGAAAKLKKLLDEAVKQNVKLEADVATLLEEQERHGKQHIMDTFVTTAIAAILRSGEELGKDGKPDVKRIEELTGLDVSAEKRDRVWALVCRTAEENKLSAPAPAGKDPKKRAAGWAFFNKKKSKKKGK